MRPLPDFAQLISLGRGSVFAALHEAASVFYQRLYRQAERPPLALPFASSARALTVASNCNCLACSSALRRAAARCRNTSGSFSSTADPRRPATSTSGLLGGFSTSALGAATLLPLTQ